LLQDIIGEHFPRCVFLRTNKPAFLQIFSTRNISSFDESSHSERPK